MYYRIGKNYRNVKRYKEIADVLVKYGFGFFVKKLAEVNLVPSYILTRKSDSLSLSTGERLRLMCEELGPTFIKLGQIASTRPDIIPDEIIDELVKLQDNVNEISLDEMKKVFYEELGKDINSAFSYFDEKPIATASIGQVYRAKLLTGEDVIIKIQKPSIKKVIDTDIAILLQMSRLFDEYFKDMFPFSLNSIIIEITTFLKYELDYTKESRNTERFQENFCNDDSVYIPKIYWEYTSKRVLTQECIKGIKVSKINELKDAGYDIKKLADIGAIAFLKQVFLYGFFHGDPHPGNIIVINEKTIGFIDFGICGYLDKNTVDLITNMFIAGSKRNIDKIVNLLFQIDSISDETDLRRLKEDLLYLVSHYFDIPLNKINISEIVTEFMRIIYENHIMLPSQFTILIKALITVEGTGRMLDPNFSISTILKEFSRDIIEHRLNLGNIITKLSSVTQDFLYELGNIPNQIRNIIKILEKNQLKINLEDIRVKNLEQEIVRASNKLSLSIIVASLIIGSSLALNAEKSPGFFDISIIPLVGYIFAFILGVIILINIFTNSIKKS